MRCQIREAAWDQAQITDASLLFVICADVKVWDKEPARYWKDASQETQEFWCPFYEGKEQLQRDGASALKAEHPAYQELYSDPRWELWQRIGQNKWWVIIRAEFPCASKCYVKNIIF